MKSVLGLPLFFGPVLVEPLDDFGVAFCLVLTTRQSGSRLVLLMLDKHTRSLHVLGRGASLLLSAIPYVQRHDSFDRIASPDLREVGRRECFGCPFSIVLNIDLICLVALHETRDN
jgi:hypothetical protein